MENRLTDEEKSYLLRLARKAIESAVLQKDLPAVSLESLSPALREEGASFVTLTEGGELRGCIGALEAYQPLALDVREHAIAAAMDDPRFPPVQPAELPRLHIEISRLTSPQPLHYTQPTDLTKLLHPHVDGVILREGFRRATFLPQVWRQIPDPEDFLSLLCRKMGSPADLWRKKILDVALYQVEEFEE